MLRKAPLPVKKAPCKLDYILFILRFRAYNILVNFFCEVLCFTMVES